jgi:four helix bundle protein
MGLGFRGLQVWNKGMELAIAIYALTAIFPDSEKFGLISQLRRAAVSVPSNVAEGFARTSTGSYVLHLGYARGSCAEIETQILISRAIGLCDLQSSANAERLNSEVSRMLNAMIRSLRP